MRRWTAALAWMFTVLCVAIGARAEQPTLSGTWSASAMRTAWSIGDWGDACGPKPRTPGAPAGSVAVSQQGSELSFAGAGRSFTTNECWDQQPGMVRVSHSGGKRGWRTVCKSPAGDSRQAYVVTTISATDTYITFDETGQYQFVIEGQNCTASVRRSRSFKLVRRAGEAAKPAATAEDEVPPLKAGPTTAPPATPKPKPTPKSTPKPRSGECPYPGPPARLEVRPSKKLMRPGESFRFRASVYDEDGCALTTAPRWSLADDAAPAKLSGPRITIDEEAPETEIEISASLGGRAATVTVEVASKERYARLLSAGDFNAEGESGEAAVTTVSSGAIGASTTEERARSRKTTFVAVVGGAAVVLGLLGLVLVLRGRRKKSASPGPVTSVSAPPPSGGEPGRVCPTCRAEYPAHAQFCSKDGNRLVRPGETAGLAAGGVCPVCGQGFDPGIDRCPTHREVLVPPAVYASARREPEAPSRKICPVCGGTYPGESIFCGKDGASLVPMN